MDDETSLCEFPRWADDVPFTIGELHAGKVVSYPNDAINHFDPPRPGETLASVQSVVVDPADRLWILDTAAPNFSKPIPGAAKLIAVYLTTDQVAQTIIFSPETALETAYINDVRFDLHQGTAVVAYLTDSSSNGLAASSLSTLRPERFGESSLDIRPPQHHRFHTIGRGRTMGCPRKG